MSAAEDRSVLPLIGAIVQANVDGLAHSTNAIIDWLERDIIEIGGVLGDLINVIDDASVIDRKTEARLRALDVRIAAALDIARRKKAEREGKAHA
jgi:hypothetical protein